MNIISNCCGKSIVQGTKQEYPLGGSTWYQSFKVEVCEECGKEAEPVEACDCCGEPFEGRMWETNLGEWCTPCVSQEVDKRAEEIRKEWGLGA